MLYIKSFSFIGLTETFVQDFDTHDYENIFYGFPLFIYPAKKISNYGRCSGGVICLKKLIFYVSPIYLIHFMIMY